MELVMSRFRIGMVQRNESRRLFGMKTRRRDSMMSLERLELLAQGSTDTHD